MELAKYQNGFKEKVYSPYTEAWQVMKTLKEADLSKQEIWDSYMNKCEDFRKKFSNELGQSIYRVMLDAGDEAKRAWNGT